MKLYSPVTSLGQYGIWYIPVSGKVVVIRQVDFKGKFERISQYWRRDLD